MTAISMALRKSRIDWPVIVRWKNRMLSELGFNAHGEGAPFIVGPNGHEILRKNEEDFDDTGYAVTRIAWSVMPEDRVKIAIKLAEAAALKRVAKENPGVLSDPFWMYSKE